MTTADATPIDLASLVQRSANQVHCQVGDLVVLMAVDNGEYFELNRVGSRLWREIASAVSVNDLVERLLVDFDTDRRTCETQVVAWVDKMQGLGFVEVARE